MEYYKLVRDNIPNIIGSEGKTFTCVSLGGQEEEIVDLKKIFLNQKILEEALEVTKSKTRKETMEELADLVEVITAYCGVLEIALEDLKTLQRVKKEEKGAFEDFVILKEVQD